MGRYPSYKPTGVSWIKEIPQEWDFSRNRFFLTEKKELVGEESDKYKLLSLTKQGVILRDISSGKGKFPKDFDTYKIVENGNIIFCLFDIDETPRTVGLSYYDGMITGAYNVFEIRDIDPRYLLYYYTSLDNDKALKPLYTGLRKTINTTTFLAAKMPVPSVPEQQQIVRYLDWKTSQINHLIHGYERLISLLDERRISAVIDKVENGTINHSEYKKSTYAWLSDYPAEWKEKKLKSIALKLSRQCNKDDELLVCSNSGKVVPRGDSKLGLIASSDDIYQGVNKGDLLIHGMDTWHGAIAVSELNGKCTPVVHVCDSKENKEYLAYYLRSLAYKNVYKKISNGVRENTSDFRSWDKAGVLPVILPSRGEQDEIVKSLIEMEKKVESLKGKYERQIELLRERRTRLISDVVTGALDVRDVVVPEYALEQDMEVTEDGDEYEGERT